jgi:hypothetical protein
MATALQGYVEWLQENAERLKIHPEVVENARLGWLEEKNMLLKAIHHALDEDGHTGAWKIEFAENYYNKISENKFSAEKFFEINLPNSDE